LNSGGRKLFVIRSYKFFRFHHVCRTMQVFDNFKYIFLHYRLTGHFRIHRRRTSRGDLLHIRFRGIDGIVTGKRTELVMRGTRSGSTKHFVEIRRRNGGQTEECDDAEMVYAMGHTR